MASQRKPGKKQPPTDPSFIPLSENLHHYAQYVELIYFIEMAYLRG